MAVVSLPNWFVYHERASAPRDHLHRFYKIYVDMCWTLVAEEPHTSINLNLEHCPLKANASCLIFSLHQGKMSSAQPLSGLDSPSQGSQGQLTSILYHPTTAPLLLLFPPLQ
jgi:hypothetical protein